MFHVHVELINNILVMQATGVELYIAPEHVLALRAITDTKQFVAYFKTQALLNRSARKLFEAWLRKDRTLWTRIYKSVQGATTEQNAEE